mgnify:CR=1 FL=1
MSPRLKVAVENYGRCRESRVPERRAFAAKLLTDVLILDCRAGYVAHPVLTEALWRLTEWTVPRLLERTRTAAETIFAVLAEEQDT